MDAVGVQRPVPFGSSVGVQVALEVAARHPGRVERLVLEGPTPDPANRSAVEQYALVQAPVLVLRGRLDQTLSQEWAERFTRLLPHGRLDHATSALCLLAPSALGRGPRTRALLAAVGTTATAYSLLTDYERGLVRKIPLPVHLNVDAGTGMQLVLAAATLLRGEPAAGRWATAALGAYEVVVANATAKPAGPAHLVPVASA